MLLHEVVATAHELAATSSRTSKRNATAAVLRRAAGHGPHTLGLVASYLAGVLPQRRPGLGWRSLSDPPPPHTEPTLTVEQVDEAFEAMSRLSGPGSDGQRAAMSDALFRLAQEPEQLFLANLVTGQLRQGALDSSMLEAIAAAFDVPATAVRRAAMLSGSTAAVAVAAAQGGGGALAQMRMQVGTAIRPMLASSAASVSDALEGLEGPVVVDAKLDGIRVQVHRDGQDIAVFSRSLDDITARVPEVVRSARAMHSDRFIVDGEALLLRPDGTPHPFQVSAAEVARRSKDNGGSALHAVFFDVLHLDGVDLVDKPTSARLATLAELTPSAHQVAREHGPDLAQAERFMSDVVAKGHEGVVVKALHAPYAAGRRGSAWVKVKPRITVDLVVLGAEWGSGRRRGKLSNIHLGARAATGEELVMVGKTFKGMTDAMLDWQTKRFLALQTAREGHIVWVRPEQLVEVAIDGVQRSRRYPGGVALRFARVLRYRDDKPVTETTTVADLQALAG